MGLAEANRKVTSGAASMACKFTASGLLREALKEANACAARAPGDPGQIPLERPEGLHILHLFNTLLFTKRWK